MPFGFFISQVTLVRGGEDFGKLPFWAHLLPAALAQFHTILALIAFSNGLPEIFGLWVYHLPELVVFTGQKPVPVEPKPITAFLDHGSSQKLCLFHSGPPGKNPCDFMKETPKSSGRMSKEIFPCKSGPKTERGPCHSASPKIGSLNPSKSVQKSLNLFSLTQKMIVSGIPGKIFWHLEFQLRWVFFIKSYHTIAELKGLQMLTAFYIVTFIVFLSLCVFSAGVERDVSIFADLPQPFFEQERFCHSGSTHCQDRYLDPFSRLKRKKDRSPVQRTSKEVYPGGIHRGVQNVWLDGIPGLQL